MIITAFTAMRLVQIIPTPRGLSCTSSSSGTALIMLNNDPLRVAGACKSAPVCIAWCRAAGRGALFPYRPDSPAPTPHPQLLPGFFGIRIASCWFGLVWLGLIPLLWGQLCGEILLPYVTHTKKLLKSSPGLHFNILCPIWWYSDVAINPTFFCKRKKLFVWLLEVQNSPLFLFYLWWVIW